MKKTVINSAILIALLGAIFAACGSSGSSAGSAASAVPAEVLVTTVDAQEPRAVFLTGGPVSSSPDDKRYAVGVKYGNIIVFDKESGNPLQVFYAGGNVTSIRWSFDGRYIHSNIDSKTEIEPGYPADMYWDTQTGKGSSLPEAEFQSAGFKKTPVKEPVGQNLAWSNDGSRLIVGTYGKNALLRSNLIIIWDMSSGSVVNSFNTDFRNAAEEMFYANTVSEKLVGQLRAVAVTPDANVVAAIPGGIRTFNAATGRGNGLFEKKFVWNDAKMAFSQDNRIMLVLNGSEPSYDGYNQVTWTYKGKLDNTSGIWGKTSAPIIEFEDTARVKPVISSYYSRIALWDRDSFKETFVLHEADVVWDVYPAGKLPPLETLEQFRDIALSPDGKLAAACGIKNVRIWDTATGRVLRNIKLSDGYKIDKENRKVGHPDFDGYSLAFSRDGSLLAVGSSYGKITLFNMKTYAQQNQIEGTKLGMIAAVGITPDNKQVLAFTVNGILAVYDTEGNEIKQIQTGPLAKPGHRSTLVNAAFSPDMTRLAVMVSDSTVQVWDIPSGKHAILAFYDPDEWAAVSFAGNGWNASEKGRMLLAQVSENASAEFAAPGNSNPGTLAAILSGKTKGLFSDENIYAPVQQTVMVQPVAAAGKKPVYQPLQDGKYTKLSKDRLVMRFPYGQYTNTYSDIDYVEVKDGQFSIYLTAEVPSTIQLFKDNYKKVRLTNLDTGKKYTPTGFRSNEKNNRGIFFDFKGVEGRRFTLTIPTISKPHTSKEFVIGEKD